MTKDSVLFYSENNKTDESLSSVSKALPAEYQSLGETCALFSMTRENLGATLFSKLYGYSNAKHAIEMDDPKLYTLPWWLYTDFGRDLLFQLCVAGARMYVILKSHTAEGAETLIYRATDQQLIKKKALELIYVQMGNMIVRL